MKKTYAILIGIGSIPFLWFFPPYLLLLPLNQLLRKAFSCSGEGCLGVFFLGALLYIIAIIIFAILFTIYLANREHFPSLRKKVIIILAIVIFCLANKAFYFLEEKGRDYAIMAPHPLSERYLTRDDCAESKFTEMTFAKEVPICLGYIAGRNNDVSLCEGYVSDFISKSKATFGGKEMPVYYCKVGFAMYKGDVKYCEQAFFDERDQLAEVDSCKMNVYAESGQSAKCKTLSDPNSIQFCQQKTKNFTTNIFIKLYAKLRGFTKKY